MEAGSQPPPDQAAHDQPGGESPLDAQRQASGGDAFEERPELFLGAAFAGGLGLALLLRRLGPS